MDLGNVRIRSESPYASIILTASDPGATLTTAKTALLSAVARACNSGFTLFGPEQKVVNNGTPPILLEPVKATITITDRRLHVVNVLDHDGRRTGKTIAVSGKSFVIDEAHDKTLYYELVFDP